MDSYEKKQKNNRKRIIMIGIVTVIVAGIVLAVTPKLQSAVKDNKSNKTTTSVTTTVEHTLPEPFENSVSYEISDITFGLHSIMALIGLQRKQESLILKVCTILICYYHK